MRTLDKRIDPHIKLAAVLVKRAPTLTLAYGDRCRSRLAATLDNGDEAAVLLPRGTILSDGDVLVAQDGGLVRVIAAPEAVLLVTSPDRLTLTRAAYHLGNRHTPVEVGVESLKLEADAVLEDMLKRLGAHVEHATLPFQPESGAYGGGHKHGHDESFAEDYALAQQVYGEHHGHSHDAHDHSHQHPHAEKTHSHAHHDHPGECEHDHCHDHAHGDGPGQGLGHHSHHAYR
ncbi:urease accessory protein UreE [Paraburkholderia flava]|uniref:urease accessory protein UreE n=1 Tax=Paraburkholderia flava TaxID=2547393 RepID=UPI00105BB4DE|nr:urease accessory protein UreE [Paraburkholderia flava]